MFRKLFVMCLICLSGVAPADDCLFGGSHSADTNGDRRINLPEVLRVIQIYNSQGSAYHTKVGTEDGFAPGECDQGYNSITVPYGGSVTLNPTTVGATVQPYNWYAALGFGYWISSQTPSLTLTNCTPVNTGAYFYRSTSGEYFFVKVTGVADLQLIAYPNNGPWLAVAFSLNGLSLGQLLASPLQDGEVVIGLKVIIEVGDKCFTDVGVFNYQPLLTGIYEANVVSFDGEGVLDCSGQPATNIDFTNLPTGTTVSFQLAVKRSDLPDTYQHFVDIRPENTFLSLNQTQALVSTGTGSWLYK
ncbi:MAG: hypothetical protein K8Q91_02535 [Candidatus Vogelbacteria bacterium]|nr:hypothetical protein [Candidatus Vogelbacteria bacterium]